MKAIVVFGANGQLGAELVKLAHAQGRPLLAFTRDEVDITRSADVQRALEQVPRRGHGSHDTVVLNAAAYTAVDRAEAARADAFAVNEGGAREVAAECARRELTLIHYSTDYVFDGNRRVPYGEEDETAPPNIYGASKLAGEKAVRDVCPRHLVLRCSSVFSAFGQNFVKTMLRLGKERPRLRVVSDQWACPTAAADIAAASVRMADLIDTVLPATAFGIYHFCGTPAVTWFDFARAIFEAAERCGRHAPILDPVAAADYAAPARRPAWPVLACGKIAKTFGIVQPGWESPLRDIVAELLDDQRFKN